MIYVYMIHTYTHTHIYIYIYNVNLIGNREDFFPRFVWKELAGRSLPASRTSRWLGVETVSHSYCWCFRNPAISPTWDVWKPINNGRLYIWAFPKNRGTPKWKTLLKWMLWRYHYFRKHPNNGILYISTGAGFLNHQQYVLVYHGPRTKKLPSFGSGIAPSILSLRWKLSTILIFTWRKIQEPFQVQIVCWKFL